MKKALVLLMVSLILLPIYAYAQTGQEAGVNTTVIKLADYRTVPYMRIQEDANVYPAAFLKSVNAMPQINPQEYGYGDNPVNKMGDGIINGTTCWAEIPKQIVEVSQNTNPLLGITYGFGKGVVDGVTRVAAGSYQVATFGIPPYENVMVKPEYKVENPEKGYRVDLLKW